LDIILPFEQLLTAQQGLKGGDMEWILDSGWETILIEANRM